MKDGLKEALNNSQLKFWLDISDILGQRHTVDRLFSNNEMRELLKKLNNSDEIAAQHCTVYWTSCYFAAQIWNEVKEKTKGDAVSTLTLLEKRMPYTYFCRHYKGKAY